MADLLILRIAGCDSHPVTESNIDDQVRIRPVESGDLISDDLPAPRPDEDGPRWRRSLVAQIGNQMIGTASLALSPVTDSYFCEINVAASHRRRGIGTRLYEEIHRLRAQPFPVLTRAMRSQPWRRAFADALGCSIRTHCPAPWIEPATDEIRQWINRQQLPEHYTTVTMAELPHDTILQAWTTYFVWAHQPFGTVHPEQVPLSWQGYSDSLDPTASMLTLDRLGAIVAFSLVSPDVWDGRTMIVAETVERDQHDGTGLLSATVAASLTVLAQRDVHRVQLEGHSTDPHLPALVNSLPSDGADPMDIVELAPPAA